MLEAEADRLCNAGRYERTAARRDQRSGSYDRKLQTTAGAVTLKVPKRRQQTFETAIIERYRRRESSVEEALIEMYPRLGGLDAQGHPRPGGSPSRPAQGDRGYCSAPQHEARQGSRAGRDGGARDPGALRLPGRALAPHQDQQSAQAHHAGDLPAEARRVVGAFPDGNSALNLAAARLQAHRRHALWSTKRI